jgi:hypothetical protein
MGTKPDPLAENERLRAALREMLALVAEDNFYSTTDTAEKARAALAGKGE